MPIYHNSLLALRKPAATVRFPRLIYIGGVSGFEKASKCK